jgi:uncharacterized protein YdcH (DUF465 family)
METVPPEDISARLMESNEEYRILARKHSNYDRRLEELSARRFPSTDEQVETQRLKKLKLQLKDRMHAILREHQARAS